MFDPGTIIAIFFDIWGRGTAMKFLRYLGEDFDVGDITGLSQNLHFNFGKRGSYTKLCILHACMHISDAHTHARRS